MCFVRALGTRTVAFAFLARTACCYIGRADTIKRSVERTKNVEDKLSIPAIILACTITGGSLHLSMRLIVVWGDCLFRGRWCFICNQVWRRVSAYETSERRALPANYLRVEAWKSPRSPIEYRQSIRLIDEYTPCSAAPFRVLHGIGTPGGFLVKLLKDKLAPFGPFSLTFAE